MATYNQWTKKLFLEKFWIGAHLEDEKGKTSKFVDSGSYKRNEREGIKQSGMGRQRRMEKIHRIKMLGTERCANITNLYIDRLLLLLLLYNNCHTMKNTI